MQTKPSTTLPPETFLYTPSLPKANDALNLAWCYPASYSIAMASLGYLMLFARLDQTPEVRATRFSTENYGHGACLNQYEVVGFSFSFELDILEVLRCFQAEHIPLRAEARGEDCPLVFSGGPVPSTNPEPYSPFFDFFLIGDGEVLLPQAMLCLKRNRHLPRRERLKALAIEVQGVYVPSLYTFTYHDAGGTLLQVQPVESGIPATVKRQNYQGLGEDVATLPILSEASVFGLRYLVEVMRGCSHRCRFCLASYSTLPARPGGTGTLMRAIEHGLKYTREVGLVGALVADHPDFEQLCAYVRQHNDVRVSFGALRADTLSPAICETLAQSGSTNVTIAIESGSPWLRRRINKHLKQESIFNAAEIASTSGLKGMKLYHMVGLPNETYTHLDESITLMHALHKAFPRLKLSLGCSTFVPKAWTPFQWMERPSTAELKKRMHYLQKGVVHACQFRPSSPKWDTFQAMVSRGDNRLAEFLEAFTELGGSHGHINRALKQMRQQGLTIPDIEWYAERQRGESERFAWDVLAHEVPRDILFKEGQVPASLLV